jgi:hypothetical protein
MTIRLKMCETDWNAIKDTIPHPEIGYVQLVVNQDIEVVRRLFWPGVPVKFVNEDEAVIAEYADLDFDLARKALYVDILYEDCTEIFDNEIKSWAEKKNPSKEH